jgi:uncharacterized protein (UPF0276 family)
MSIKPKLLKLRGMSPYCHGCSFELTAKRKMHGMCLDKCYETAKRVACAHPGSTLAKTFTAWLQN